MDNQLGRIEGDLSEGSRGVRNRLEGPGLRLGCVCVGLWRKKTSTLPEDADPEKMVKAWGKLRAAFKRNTKVGKSHLELGIGHYSSDDGDRYDEIGQGCYFTVDDVIQFTPAGEKFRVHLEEKSWTVFA